MGRKLNTYAQIVEHHMEAQAAADKAKEALERAFEALRHANGLLSNIYISNIPKLGSCQRR